MCKKILRIELFTTRKGYIGTNKKDVNKIQSAQITFLRSVQSSTVLEIRKQHEYTRKELDQQIIKQRNIVKIELDICETIGANRRLQTAKSSIKLRTLE